MTTAPRHGLRIGALPAPADLIPQTFTGLALSATSLIAGTMVAGQNGMTPGNALLVGGLTVLALALGRQIETAQERRGCILKEGGILIREHWEDARQRSRVDAALTELYKAVLDDETALVERHQSDQYDIHVIYNQDPDAIRSRMTKIARKLGLKPEQLMYYPVWGQGSSAILAHRPQADWESVPFDPHAVVPDRMILQAGRSITGQTITYNRETYPHALIAGETGAGKTEAMVADIRAAQATGLNPQIYVIDPKNTPQLKRLAAQQYVNDAQWGIELLESIVGYCEERLNRYSDAGCDNYWQYRDKVDSSERPIMLYVDEVAELVSPDVAADPKEAKQLAGKAIALITRLVQKYRSAGLFVTLGMQHPLAEVLSTNIRNNLGIRIILSVADHHAAKVAGVPGAENLPMQGGMILKEGKNLTYGRGVFVS